MTKGEQARLVAWRLRILQYASESQRRVAQTCRHVGISRKTFYKWKKRYDADGAAGVGDRPHAIRSAMCATMCTGCRVDGAKVEVANPGGASRRTCAARYASVAAR